MVTPLKTLMGFSVHLNVQLKFYNLPKYNIFNYGYIIAWFSDLTTVWLLLGGFLLIALNHISLKLVWKI